MQELQAVNYGKVELIPGIICDGYVLDNGTTCLYAGTGLQPVPERYIF